jgi:hypothetical protein
MDWLSESFDLGLIAAILLKESPKSLHGTGI